MAIIAYGKTEKAVFEIEFVYSGKKGRAVYFSITCFSFCISLLLP